MLFKISGTDFTNQVQSDSYDINKDYEYDEWQSADGKYHRDLTRTRIKGDFDMVFISSDSTGYLAFLNLINQVASNNTIKCDLYVGNEGKAETDIVCFYEIEFKSRVNTNGSTYIDKITLNLKEQ